MSRDIPDDDPKKWTYTDHARAKHAIQQNYLGAWLAILGTHLSPLVLFDGFAGRGRYVGGEDGSPLLFWKRAVKAVEAGRPRHVDIDCVELNSNNFNDLRAVAERLQHPDVSIQPIHGDFATEAIRKAAELSQRTWTPPVFWTADPFGFRGVPLSVIKELMALPRSEVLITFMVRDMRRFLDQENFEAPLSEFFGGEAWRNCTAAEESEQREQCLLLTYSELVRDGVARFATPFRVFEDERRQTLYYLVHLTNHPLGMREMKRAMIKESPDMTFWPVTVRPPDQLALDVAEPAPYASLQAHLAETFLGRTLTFEDLMNEDYPRGLWLEPEYREALLSMLRTGTQVTVERPRSTKTGRSPHGLKHEDLLTFSGQPRLV